MCRAATRIDGQIGGRRSVDFTLDEGGTWTGGLFAIDLGLQPTDAARWGH
jgi:hypothetical protein